MTDQQHADASRQWKTQVFGQVVAAFIGVGVLGFLGWIGANTSDNNESLTRLETTIKHAVQEQSEQGSDISRNAAERDAQNEALGTSKTLADVGQEVRDIVAQRNGDDGAAIKKARRRAKLAIDAATTPAEIEAVAVVDWSAL